MEFIIKELEENDWFVNGQYEISKDSTIKFSAFGGGFELLLGNGYHYSLDVDCETGRCFSFYGLLNVIKNNIKNEEIDLPQTHKAKLLFNYDKLNQGSGCHYIPFKTTCYWDKANKLLCIGDKNTEAETIEFSTGTFAKVKNKQLIALYLKLNLD